MNQFLIYIIERLAADKDAIEELIRIDNRIQYTDFRVEDIVRFIKENIYRQKLLDIEIGDKTNILTEGEPLLVLKVLNDFHDKIDNLYIDKTYVGINKWLHQKSLEYHQNGINLDLTSVYDEYIIDDLEAVAIGSNSFVTCIKMDYKKEIPSLIIN